MMRPHSPKVGMGTVPSHVQPSSTITSFAVFGSPSSQAVPMGIPSKMVPVLLMLRVVATERVPPAVMVELFSAKEVNQPDR